MLCSSQFRLGEVLPFSTNSFISDNI